MNLQHAALRLGGRNGLVVSGAHRAFLRDRAAEVTARLNIGIFPGLRNRVSLSMVQVPRCHVKLIHSTKTNSPDEPVQLAFSVIDDSGKEEIVTSQCPNAASLYELVAQAGWLGRTTARPIRAMQTRVS